MERQRVNGTPLYRLNHYGMNTKRVIKRNGVIILTATQPFASIAILSNPKWFKCEWIWVKSRSGSPLTAKYMPLKLHENILVFCEGRTKTYNPQMTTGEPYKRDLDHIGKENNHRFGIKRVHSENNGTRFPLTVQKIKQNWSRQQQIHPTQKPVELMEYLIKTYTNKNEVVLDNAMGSGTTGIACINTVKKVYRNGKRGKIFCYSEQAHSRCLKRRVKLTARN